MSRATKGGLTYFEGRDSTEYEWKIGIKSVPIL